jgi:hypothetical protein
MKRYQNQLKEKLYKVCPEKVTVLITQLLRISSVLKSELFYLKKNTHNHKGEIKEYIDYYNDRSV